jgi:hypothetical protein
VTDPVVSMEPTELAVEPGGQTRVTITVSNPGTIVENYRLEVLAERPEAGPDVWSQCFPEELSIYPREKGEAIVVLSPPADAVSGRQPFAVKVSSTVPPYASAVAEGDVDVGPKYGLQAAITPVTSSGRWRGRHLITYTNWGNAPVRLRLTTRDPDEKLGFLLQPQEVALPIGGKASVRLAVRTRKPFMRGPQQRLPFEVSAEPDEPGALPTPPPAIALPSDPRRPVLSGAFNQKPIVSKLALAAGALATALAAAAVVLALRIPKPHHPAPAVGLPPPPGSYVVLIVQDLVQTGTPKKAVGIYSEALSLGYQPKGTIFTGDYKTVNPPNLPPFKMPYYGAYKGPFPTADAALNEQPVCSATLRDPTTHTPKLICLAVQLGPKN